MPAGQVVVVLTVVCCAGGTEHPVSNSVKIIDATSFMYPQFQFSLTLDDVII
jgi:hypothetical protein